MTLTGTAVQLPLAYALSGLGLPGICLALALSMTVQCAVLFVWIGRHRQEDARVSLVRAA